MLLYVFNGISSDEPLQGDKLRWYVQEEYIIKNSFMEWGTRDKKEGNFWPESEAGCRLYYMETTRFKPVLIS